MNRVKGITYENRIRKELELKGKNGREEDFKKEKKIKIDWKWFG